MIRSRVGEQLARGSAIIGVLIGAALIVGTSVFASRATSPSSAGGTPRLQGQRDVAQGDRSGSPATIPGTVEWRFSEPQPDWKSALPVPRLRFSEPRPDSALPVPGLPLEMAGLERTKDALRVTLFDGSRLARRSWAGGVYVDLPDWRREEWAEVVVSARTTGSVNRMSIGLNPPEGVVPAGANQVTFQARGGLTPIVRDGLVHTYRIHLDWGSQRNGPWRRMGLQFEAPGPGSIDILSVRVVPAAADGRVIETTLDPPQLKSDFALLRKALEEAHPTLYRYATERDMNAAFAKADAALTRPLTILQFRNVLAPVLAAIKDGHLGLTNFQGDEISTVVDLAKQFPLALTFESKRALVLLNQGLDDRVKPGMEVLDINGESLGEILRQILPNLTHDGDVQSWQRYQLGMWAGDGRSRGFFQVGGNRRTGFSEAYRLYIADPPSFRTTLRDPQTRNTVVVDLAGVTAAEAAINVEKNQVNRDVLAGLRTLRVGFGSGSQAIRYLDSETAIVANAFGANFPDVLKTVFSDLKSKGTKNLIIDMRGNTGGNDVYPVLLFSYLTSKAFRAVEGARMNTYQPSFKQYTGLGEIDPVTDPYYGSAAGFWKPDSTGGWLMTEKYGSTFGSTFMGTIGVQKPSENHFEGPVYVLIDGGCFSACSQFTVLADYYKRATFIGEETGGVGSGGGGDGIGPTLPESHLHLSMRIESYFFVVDKNTRRGTLPRYAVRQTIDDVANGCDTVLEFTRELIRSGKGR